MKTKTLKIGLMSVVASSFLFAGFLYDPSNPTTSGTVEPAPNGSTVSEGAVGNSLQNWRYGEGGQAFSEDVTTASPTPTPPPPPPPVTPPPVTPPPVTPPPVTPPPVTPPPVTPPPVTPPPVTPPPVTPPTPVPCVFLFTNGASTWTSGLITSGSGWEYSQVVNKGVWPWTRAYYLKRQSTGCSAVASTATLPSCGANYAISCMSSGFVTSCTHTICDQ